MAKKIDMDLFAIIMVLIVYVISFYIGYLIIPDFIMFGLYMNATLIVLIYVIHLYHNEHKEAEHD